MAVKRITGRHTKKYRTCLRCGQARRRLLAKAKARDLEAEAWIDTYQDWLEELAQMPEKERAVELNIMSDEMRRRVLLYFDRRNKG